MKKKLLILMVVCAMLLTSCGASANSTSGPGTGKASSPSSETVATSQTTSQKAEAKVPPADAVSEDNPQQTAGYDPSIGPVIPELTWNYDSGKYTCILYQYDINTGAKRELWTYEYQNKKSYAPMIAPNANLVTESGFRVDKGIGWKYGNIFSPDMTKMAVLFFDDSNGNHVGYVDKNGNLTDITGLVHPYTDDFTSKVPQDNNACFLPDGQFVFCDHNNNSTVYVDTNTNKIVKEVPKETHYNYAYSNGEMIDTYSRLESSYPVNGFLDYCFGADNNTILGVKNTAAGGSIIKYDRSAQTETKITPDTDYSINGITYYKGRIAFIGQRGTNIVLFVMDDTNGVGDVKKVCDLPMFSDSSYPNNHSYGAMFWK